MNTGIYRITNINTGKVYIGSSANLKHRLYCHKWELKKNKHHSFLLQRSWNKHGEEAFAFEVIEHCERDKLPEREQHWMDFYLCSNPLMGYNRSPTAGTTAGCVKTPETREKIAASKRGRTPWNKGLKGAQKWAEDDPRRKNPPAKGRKRTTEEKKAIGEKHKANGHKPSQKCLDRSLTVRQEKAKLREKGAASR